MALTHAHSHVGTFVGLATLDIVYAVPRYPTPNSKNVATHQEVFAGGPATNAAIAFSHLGGTATLLTVVGSHILGSVIRHDIARYGVRCNDLVPEFDGMPALSSISVTEGSGDRLVVSANATRLPAPPDTFDLAPIDESAIVLVDGHHMEACVAAARYARSRGVCVVLDGGSWKAGMESLISSVDVAICSENFIPPGCHKGGVVLDYLLREGAKEAAITRGEKSILFASCRERGEIPVSGVQAVDTLGAGDIFHGAFCYARAQGKHFREALAFASVIATRSCTYFGTRAWMTGG